MEILSKVVQIVAPLFLIVGVGYFYGARVRPEMRITNQLVMDVFMPALVLSVMIREDFYPLDYLNLMLAGALLMLGSGVLAFFFAKAFKFDWRAFVPPAMFSNWANLGIPLYVLALGEIALGAGVMLVVVGNILCFTIGTYIYSGKLSSLEVLKTPIIMAVIVGGAINAMEVNLPVSLIKSVTLLGQVAIPLMLFSLGVRLTKVCLADAQVGMAMAIFCPVIGVALAYPLSRLLPMPELHQDILVLFGVLPPAVVNFMLAEQYNKNPGKVASMVLIGNLFAIISIPLVLLLVLRGG